jgi:type IV secretion system protein VirB4
MPEVLAVLSGRESTVRKLDQLRQELGENPSAWFSALTGAQWPGQPDEQRSEIAA